MLSDWMYGPHRYKIVKELNDWIDAMFLNEQERIKELFEHLFFEITSTVWDESSEQYLIQKEWFDAGLSYEDIVRDFKSKYRKRLVAMPWYYNSAEGNAESLADLKDKLSYVLDKYYEKYKRLAGLAGLQYDPLDNTNVSETGSEAIEESGKKTKTHTVDLDAGATSMVIEGPLNMGENGTTASLNTSETTQSLDLVFQNDPNITQTTGIADTTKQGAAATLANQTASIGAASDKVRTTSYSGPYNGTNNPDEHNDAILDSTVLSEGQVGEATNSSTKTNTFVNGKATFGNPSAYNYTDTEEADNNDKPKKTRKPDLNEKGYRNVDIADVIEKQRKLAKFSILDEFFKDLSLEVLLGTWN